MSSACSCRARFAGVVASRGALLRRAVADCRRRAGTRRFTLNASAFAVTGLSAPRVRLGRAPDRARAGPASVDDADGLSRAVKVSPSVRPARRPSRIIDVSTDGQAPWPASRRGHVPLPHRADRRQFRRQGARRHGHEMDRPGRIRLRGRLERPVLRDGRGRRHPVRSADPDRRSGDRALQADPYRHVRACISRSMCWPAT